VVDKTRPLKLEDVGTGSSLDGFPTEMNPAQDYASVKGVALEESNDTTIRGDVGVMKFKDSVVTTEVTLEQLLDGGSGASPGYTWGRAGTTTAGTWLLNEGVPSNKAGRTVFLATPIIYQLYSATEDLDTYVLTFYSHDGNSVNLTSLGTLTVTASRTGTSTVSLSFTSGKQLAIELTSGSAKNIVAGVIIKGTV
jgi:hypothetical protein